MSAFIDFWLRGITPGDSPIDHRAVAESELADYTASLPPGDPSRPLVHVNADCDWLAADTPSEWIADMLATLSRYPACDYHLFTLDPEFWQQRLAAVARLTGPGAEIARRWLDGIAPVGIRVSSVPAKESILNAIPCRRAAEPATAC